MNLVSDVAREANAQHAELEVKIQEKISDPKYAEFLSDPYFNSAEFRAPIVKGLENEVYYEAEKKRILDDAHTAFADKLPLTRGAYSELEKQFSQQRSLYNDDTYKMSAVVEAENVCEGGTARSEVVSVLAKKYLCPAE